MAIPEISPRELMAELEAGKEVHLLDIRSPKALETTRIENVAPDCFFNIPGSKLMAGDLGSFALARDKRWTVVCGEGNDSRKIAAFLNENGYRAASMRGGMFAWMGTAVARELEPPAGLDRLIQLDRIGKGALAHLLVSDGEALVVDPSRHTAQILETTRAAGAGIVAVADTHAHADYISGGPALAQQQDVPYYLHPRDAVYPYDGTPGTIEVEPAREGTVIRFGRAEITVLHTPGHTEGSVTYRLGDDLALTGDFLFVRTVGRPDLGGKTAEWTAVLFESLQRARREWPDRMRIHPAHYSSNAERNPDRSIGRPFGELRSSNGQLAMLDGEQFAAWVSGRAGSFPEAYRRIKGINVGIMSADEDEMNELEAGRNQCALG